jgi:hypothetical protein
MDRRLLATCVACFSVLWGVTTTSQQVGSFRGVVVLNRPMTKDGWWIRVNTSATKATRIDWRIGTPNSATAATTWWFHSGHPPEVWVEPPLRHENALRVQVTTTPVDAPASMCVFWQRHGVALMEFTGQAERQLDATQTESACVP